MKTHIGIDPGLSGGDRSMKTPIATLKTTPTPQIIRRILAHAALDGADAVVIHLPKTSEDEICFLYLLVPESSPRPDAPE